MKSLRLILIGMPLLGMPTSASYAEPITQLLAFGDSTTDTGNVFATLGIPAPPYFQGRASNGPVWVEYLAARLGVPAPTPSSAGGTNYAWFNAETGSGLSSGLRVPNIGTQVASYLSANRPSPNQLIAIWGAGNDFLSGQTTDPSVPVMNLAAAITALTAAGGKNFVVPNLPQLGLLPGAQGLSPSERQAFNSLTLAYNALLAAELDRLEPNLGITAHLLDIEAITQEVRVNPASFGFTNATGSALDDGVISGLGYFFYDGAHPSTTAHLLFADRAYSSLVVPEPSSLVLLFTAMVGLIGWRCGQAGEPPTAAEDQRPMPCDNAPPAGV